MKSGALLLVLGALIIALAVGIGCTQQQPAGAPPVGAGPAPSVTPNAPHDTATTAVPPETSLTPTRKSGQGSTPTPQTPPKARPFQLPTPTPEPPKQPLSGRIDGYMAIAPQVLRSGQTENVSVSLFHRDVPAQGIVRVSLETNGRESADASGLILGTGSIALSVPDLPKGNYRLRVRGPGFQDTTSLRVESGSSLFLETDKPIYKPGQKVMMRVLIVDPELRPLTGEIVLEVQDAKGPRCSRRPPKTNEFGMATLDMPLSNEPNLGVWKITARTANTKTELDVRVEEYVLPKYEISVDLPKEWVLANEKITGQIDAEYTFGKPVRGEVEIVASRYAGVWEEFATLTRDIDGSESFELPPVGYVAGVPAGRGMGNVSLDVTVREKSTGYEETTTRLVTVANTPVNLHLVSESRVFKPSLPFSFLVVAETPDNKPVDARVSVDLTYMGERLQRQERQTHHVTTRNGTAVLTVKPPEGVVALAAEARAGEAHAALAMQASYSPSGSFIHVTQQGPGTLAVGGHARFRVHATKETTNFYYEVVARGKVVFSQVSQSPDISFPVTPVMAPGSRILVYQLLPNSEVAADYLPFEVAAVYPHQVNASFEHDQVAPGEAVNIHVETQGPSHVGLAAVDRSVFILAENRLNLQQVFDKLERLYMQPQLELHDVRLKSRVATRGALETFKDAGVVVMSNKRVPEGKEFHGPTPTPAPAMMRVVKEIVRDRAVAQATIPDIGSHHDESRTLIRRREPGPATCGGYSRPTVLSRNLALDKRGHQRTRPGNPAGGSAGQHHHVGAAGRRDFQGTRPGHL